MALKLSDECVLRNKTKKRVVPSLQTKLPGVKRTLDSISDFDFKSRLPPKYRLPMFESPRNNRITIS